MTMTSNLNIFIEDPPSVNAMYSNVTKRKEGSNARGRNKTPEYKAWLEVNSIFVNMQRPSTWVPLNKHIQLIIDIERKSMNADISNKCKATEDLLVKTGIIEDDRFVHQIMIEWRKQGDLKRPSFMAHDTPYIARVFVEGEAE